MRSFTTVMLTVADLDLPVVFYVTSENLSSTVTSVIERHWSYVCDTVSQFPLQVLSSTETFDF